jgi:lysophospholipase L1-like esterase
MISQDRISKPLILMCSFVCFLVLILSLTVVFQSLTALFVRIPSLVFLLVYFFSCTLLIICAAKKQIKINWLIPIIILSVLLIIPELVLRLVGFRYESGIQFGHPRPSHFTALEADELLFWKFKTGQPEINSLGFKSGEVSIPKPDHTKRIVFLGDSCTEQGYPAIVETFVNSLISNKNLQVEAVTFAIPGYSSHQGKKITELLGDKVEPDLVVVYFGWNDHWLAYGDIDSQKKSPNPKNELANKVQWFHNHSRILQFVNKAIVTLSNSDSGPLDETRVSVNEYSENLGYIGHFFVERNIPVIFITAPTSHYRHGVPDYLVALNFATDKESVIRLHRKYNEVVRDVAARTSGYLLDLESEINEMHGIQEIFLSDGIHFTQHGLALVAFHLTQFIATNEQIFDLLRK